MLSSLEFYSKFCWCDNDETTRETIDRFRGGQVFTICVYWNHFGYQVKMRFENTQGCHITCTRHHKAVRHNMTAGRSKKSHQSEPGSSPQYPEAKRWHGERCERLEGLVPKGHEMLRCWVIPSRSVDPGHAIDPNHKEPNGVAKNGVSNGVWRTVYQRVPVLCLERLEESHYRCRRCFEALRWVVPIRRLYGFRVRLCQEMMFQRLGSAVANTSWLDAKWRQRS